MQIAERPPIDLDSIPGINSTYEYYRDLETDPELSRKIHQATAFVFHTEQIWVEGSQEKVTKGQGEDYRTLWLPGHYSNANPFQEAAECFQEPCLQDWIGNVSILTKPDWYDKPLIGRAIRALYDTVPAIPISRHEDKDLRDYANDKAIDTMAHRMLHKGENGVLYPTKKRIKENHHVVPPPEKLAVGPERIAAALREEGIKLMFLISGRWSGATKFTRATRGMFWQVMVHSVVDAPKDLSTTQGLIHTHLQLNTLYAQQIFNGGYPVFS